MATTGGSLCTSAQGNETALTHIGTGITNTTTPTVADFQQLVHSVDQAVDSLDSSAPSAIASDFHAIRAAYDQANTQVQGATSMQQISAAFSVIGSASLRPHITNVENYFQANCHF